MIDAALWISPGLISAEQPKHLQLSDQRAASQATQKKLYSRLG